MSSHSDTVQDNNNKRRKYDNNNISDHNTIINQSVHSVPSVHSTSDSTVSIQKSVASHYNTISNVSHHQRLKSPIIG